MIALDARTKKTVIVLSIILMVLAGYFMLALYYRTRIEGSPQFLVDLYINKEPVVKGGTWTLKSPAFEIFKYRGKPIYEVKVDLKLKWSVKTLNAQGEYKAPAKTDIKMIVVAFWGIDGYFGWCNMLGQCGNIQHDYATTIHYAKSLMDPYDYMAQLFTGMKPEIGRNYAAVIYPSPNGFVQSFIYEMAKNGVIRYAYVNKLVDDTIIPLMKTPGKIQKIDVKPDWFEEIVKATQPSPVQIEDGKIMKVYTLDRMGMELQSDLANLVFGKGTFGENYVLITDNANYDFKLQLWIFVSYQWKDANGKWTPVFQGVQKMLEIPIDVAPGYWINVYPEVSSTGTIVPGYVQQGSWTINP